MKLSILFLSLTLYVSASAQFTNTTGEATSVPLSEVSHEKVDGKIITQSDLEIVGKISYDEYGETRIKVFREGQDVLLITNADTLKSMKLEGRGLFKTLATNPESDSRILALLQEDKPAYAIYQILVAPSGLLGNKIQGGNIEGYYEKIIFNKRTNTYIYKRRIQKLKKHIIKYIDYCPEVTDKILAGKKGYKTSLLMRSYHLLLKAIEESNEACPK